MQGWNDENAPNRCRPPGFGPPELTDNEIAWVEFLRMICNGRDIGPTLAGVRLLRRLCERR
ncbi:hypothetical protein DZK27_15930 [Rhodobacteraceae bacterium 63075]|nr:hypothetical protein DZK27_15930 [Rhodobacteraceae bacterium 63075]